MYLLYSFLAMSCAIVHSSRINYLFSIHCICIKSCHFLWSHVSIIRNWTHIAYIEAGPLSGVIHIIYVLFLDNHPWHDLATICS